MDKENELLSRLAANHLYLAQFESLRAIMLTLRSKNPDLALSILQTIVANSGRFENILWSPSCPSPSLLAYLSTLELLQFSNSTSETWGFDPGILRLRAEFILLVQLLSDLVTQHMGKNVDLESTEKEKENDDFSEEMKSELGDCVRVLDKVLELGMKRLKPDIIIDQQGSERGAELSVSSIEEGEIMRLSRIILDHADVLKAFCWNIQQQLKGSEFENLGLAITVRRDEKAGKSLEEEEEVVKMLALMQRSVQLAHLAAIRENLESGEEELAFCHIRYLHFDRGVEEAEYRYAKFGFLSM